MATNPGQAHHCPLCEQAGLERDDAIRELNALRGKLIGAQVDRAKLAAGIRGLLAIKAFDTEASAEWAEARRMVESGLV